MRFFPVEKEIRSCLAVSLTRKSGLFRMFDLRLDVIHVGCRKPQGAAHGCKVNSGQVFLQMVSLMKTLFYKMSTRNITPQLVGRTSILPLLAFVILATLLSPSMSLAQAKKKDKEEIAEPENITLETKDRVLLKCTYYAGPDSKNTVPMILLHDWEGEREDVAVMARLMQEKHGRSVIIPDLRGHGDSTEAKGYDKPLDYKRFKKREIEGILIDIETCKKYLVKRNNEGELNINMLIVGAVGQMNVHALTWTLADWNYGPPRGGIKQGQDVQGLIMIGPQRKLKNFSLVPNLKEPLISGKGFYTIPIVMVYGSRNPSESKEAKAIYATLEKGREKGSKKDKEDKGYWDASLFKMNYRTNQTAEAMIGSTDNGTKDIAKNFSEFITKKVEANAEDFRWSSRAKK